MYDIPPLKSSATVVLGARDEEHLDFARRKGYVVVSHDDDFLRLVAEGALSFGPRVCAP
ncbi:DUF5615 family PIN-like protein [Salinibacter ruber]|uniref:DUF5615 family PIN-like protein n=1 Tax=Salinibacter ruber TaxID=146919 RepID=UPI003C6DFA3D